MNRISGSEKGAGKVGTLIGLVLLIAAIVWAVKFIPARVKVYDFKDQAELQARALSTGQIRKPETVMRNLLQKARDLELPVKEENIKIEKGSHSWYIRLDYTYPINYFVYTQQWHVKQEVEGIRVAL